MVPLPQEDPNHAIFSPPIVAKTVLLELHKAAVSMALRFELFGTVADEEPAGANSNLRIRIQINLIEYI